MPETTDLFKIAIISFALTLILNIIVGGYTNANDLNYDPSTQSNYGKMFGLVGENQIDTVTCENANSSCESVIQQTSTKSTNIISDAWSSAVNIGKFMKIIGQIANYTGLFPAYCIVTLVPLIHNYLLKGLVTVFLLGWQVLMVWILYKAIRGR